MVLTLLDYPVLELLGSHSQSFLEEFLVLSCQRDFVFKGLIELYFFWFNQEAFPFFFVFFLQHQFVCMHIMSIITRATTVAALRATGCANKYRGKPSRAVMTWSCPLPGWRIDKMTICNMSSDLGPILDTNAVRCGGDRDRC